MIALLIGVFLLGALLTIVQANKQVFVGQNLAAQLQDDERMAMTMMTDVIESAGYYTNPYLNSNPFTTPTLSFNLTGAGATPWPSPLQFISGIYNAAPPGDQITVLTWTDTLPPNGSASEANILNCSGLGNQTGGPLAVAETFEVLNGQLICIMNGTQYTLVGDANVSVHSLNVLYGVKTSATAGNNVDTYMTATQVGTLPNPWTQVISVLVTLTFTNPAYATGQGPQYVSIQRVIGLMNQTGPVI
jgi:type IV pilus assembly protein PilW